MSQTKKLSFYDVRDNARAFIGFYREEVSSLSAVLSRINLQDGKDVFLDPERLKEKMQEYGASELECQKILLLISVEGFREIIIEGGVTSQNDIDLFVQKAIRESGLSRSAVLTMIGDLAMAQLIPNVTVLSDRNSKLERGLVGVPAVIIPTTYYDSEWKTFCAECAAANNDPIKLQAAYQKLEPLVKAGVPKAESAMGEYLLDQDPGSEEGVRLLTLATDSGHASAAARLGDYYYERNKYGDQTRAYEMYTGYGATALTAKRREALRDILDRKAYNGKALYVYGILIAALIAFVLLSPARVLYPGVRILGWVFVAISAAAISITVLHYKKYPYDDVSWSPVITFGLWLILTCVRILA